MKRWGLIFLAAMLLLCAGCAQDVGVKFSDIYFVAKNDTWTRIWIEVNAVTVGVDEAKCSVQVYAGNQLVETEEFHIPGRLGEVAYDVYYPKNPQNTEDITEVKVAVVSCTFEDGKTVDYSRHLNWKSSNDES